jgi:hypothetical protein
MVSQDKATAGKDKNYLKNCMSQIRKIDKHFIRQERLQLRQQALQDEARKRELVSAKRRRKSNERNPFELQVQPSAVENAYGTVERQSRGSTPNQSQESKPLFYEDQNDSTV